MNNFKSGDLALVIGANDESCIGRVVTIDYYAGKCSARLENGEWIGYSDEQEGLPTWAVSCDGEGSYAFDKNLMPLRGDFTPERQKSQEVPA